MNKYILYCILLLHLPCHALSRRPEDNWLKNAVTHGIPLGRMGDFLTWYIKAKYVAHKYQTPFLLNVPHKHPHLEEVKRLALYQKEMHLDEHLYFISYSGAVRNEDEVRHVKKPLIVVQHDFKASNWSLVDGHEDVSEWHDVLNDSSFRNMLREMIKVTDSNIDRRLDPPTDRIAVALHLRTGQAWDPDENRVTWYYKFPTIEFYVSALKSAVDLFNGAKMSVTIFTDDPNPVELMNTLMNEVGKACIRFRCRGTGNYPTTNILDDLEAMAKYDVLIRGMSGFAQVAQLLGDHKIVIYPQKFNGRQVEQITVSKKANFKELLVMEKK